MTDRHLLAPEPGGTALTACRLYVFLVRRNALRRLLLASLCLATCGCTAFPEVAKIEGPASPVPALQPLEGLLPDAAAPADPAPALAARAADLQTRAAAIGTP